MPEVICDTSPLQYLHQLGLIHILRDLAERVIVPPAVLDELSQGRSSGYDLPRPERLSWVVVRQPASPSTLRLVHDLGPGESQVLAVALETPGSVAVLDDRLARREAEVLQLPLTGTLGLLLDAKHTGLVAAVAPLLDRLQQLHFRVAPHTRAAVLRLASERD